MANSYADPTEQAHSQSYTLWVAGLGLLAVLSLGLGLWSASLASGVARPWMGVGLVKGMGLALVVGASKTSSA
jgi:hypothetical protein